MSSKLSKLIVLDANTFDKFNKKISDSDFLQRKLLPIYASHSLKDISKWYEIKQELAKFLIGKQKINISKNKMDENKWKNLRDNETQTRRIYKKHMDTQTLGKELKSVGSQANFNLPEEVFENKGENEDDFMDMDTTIHKINHDSASSAAKRLKDFSNKGSPKFRKLSKDENLKQSTLPYKYSPRTRNQKKELGFIPENVKWQNI